ncbi:MAG: type IX secretion system protein PorQ [Cyclonatronaceae bacterium]
MKSHLILCLLIASGWIGLVSTGAAARSGTGSVFGFLNVPGSARTAALGGNHVSLPHGGTAHFEINPGYLDPDSHKELTLSYLNHFSDIYLGAAALGWHRDGLGTLATGIRFVNYGDFTRTDSDGLEHGSFDAYDFAWSTAFTRTLLPNLRAGIGTQFIMSSYAGYRSSALALFGGAFYSFNNDLTQAGIAFRQLGTQLTRFDETREELPLTLMAGITHRLQHLPLRFSLALHSLDRWNLPVFDDESDPGFTDNLFRHMRFGTEFLFSENFNLRLGYDHLHSEELKTDSRIDLSGASIGLGIVIRDIRFDISRTSYSETGGLIQLNIGTRL